MSPRWRWKVNPEVMHHLPGGRSLRVQLLVPTAVIFVITLALGGIFASERYRRDVGQLQRQGIEHFVGRVAGADAAATALVQSLSARVERVRGLTADDRFYEQIRQ